MYVASTKQMKQIDEYLITEEGFTILELIDLASKKLFEEVKCFKHPLILCGPGNNGADGLALAKLFKDNSKDVTIKCFYKEKANAQVKYYLDTNSFDTDLDYEQFDVIIDGIFGNGLSYKIDDNLKAFINQINKLPIKRVSIDSPTNISGDLGKLDDIVFNADITITFMCYKPSMLNSDLNEYFGDIVLKEFGIENNAINALNITKLIDKKAIKQIIKSRHYNDYKGTYGTVLHLTGSSSYIGASILAALGSIKSGSGIVKVCSEKEVLKAVSYHLMEPVLEELDINNLNLNKYQSILFGCGKGWNKSTTMLLNKVIEECMVPLVIDADGLNVLSENIDLLKKTKCKVILTPHIGELRRLCGEGENYQQKAIELSKKYGLITLVKGPNTFVTDGYHHYCNTTGNPAMASAGMGDVLAGIISSFCGQGYNALEAALLGVYIHGKCADTLAIDKYSVTASEVAKQIPYEMKKCL